MKTNVSLIQVDYHQSSLRLRIPNYLIMTAISLLMPDLSAETEGRRALAVIFDFDQIITLPVMLLVLCT